MTTPTRQAAVDLMHQGFLTGLTLETASGVLAEFDRAMQDRITMTADDGETYRLTLSRQEGSTQ